MELEGVKKKYLELEKGDSAAIQMDSLPHNFFENFVKAGIRVHLIELGRVLCSFTAPPHWLNSGGFIHGGAIATLVDVLGSAVILTYGVPTTGVSVDINMSYLDAAFPNEEIEIDAKALRVGKTLGVVSVEFRKKATGKIIAQGRHTKYLAINSKI